MKHNIGTIEVLNPNEIILLEANSSLRYKGPKYMGLKRSIKNKGVLSPIDVGRLDNKDHAANGNRRTKICCETGVKEIRAIVHNVKNHDELHELFMELNLNTQQISAVQLTDMYLKGMNAKYLNLSIRKSIQKLNDIYKATTKSNAVLRRMVNINKSPRSYVIALEKLVEYVNTDEVKTNEFAKKILYWMLNIQKSAWDVTYCIKASCPVELLVDSINNREEITDDWWVNV
jgi:hypothetical protein|tara:strand:- start:2 stop:694 length:693 start_codon:yes stop_codon:yes gene_type:complete